MACLREQLARKIAGDRSPVNGDTIGSQKRSGSHYQPRQETRRAGPRMDAMIIWSVGLCEIAGDEVSRHPMKITFGLLRMRWPLQRHHWIRGH